VAEVVADFEGYVAKFMGDGVLIYFGYPQAHEDDAERAVRAGLALVERIGRLQSGSGPLASRIGIATGLVVVGDLIGAGDSQERGVVGETPNLAARLQERIPGSPEAGHLAALKTLWQLAYREASTVAYADAFRAIMLAFIVATLLVPLLRNVAASPASASASH
jgi:class 3 adenylate cyclase